MNMAFIGILLLFFVVIRAQSEERSFVKVECKTENVGQYGQQSMLDCVVKTRQEVNGAQILVVTWKKDGSTLLVFNRGKRDEKTGYKFAEPSWNDRNMNISLLITNTTLANEGNYTCMVMTDSGDSTQSTSLRVTAKYNKPKIHSSPENISRNEDVILFCSSVGGYPKGQLRWFDEHNEEWTGSSEMKAEQTNGLFKLSSKLSLLKSSIFSEYTCVVFNASGGKEDEVTLKIPDRPPEGREGGTGLAPASKIVAPVVVIGSLIVGLLLVLLVYRRRSQQTRRFSATPLMNDHREVNRSEPDAEEGDYAAM